MRRAAACVALIVFSGGEALASERASLWLLDDNDFWAQRGTDVDYSNDLEAHLRLPLAWPRGARWAQAGGSLGHAIFTPPNLRVDRLDELRLDRPYAGWLWATLLLEGAFGAARLRAEARLGVVGPLAFGEQAQRAWHSTNRAPDPRGWGVAQVDDQLDLGLRLGAGLRAARLDLAPAWGGSLALDLSPGAGCEAGALRVWCGASALLRAGALREASASGAALHEAPLEPPWADASGQRPTELFAFAGGEARYTARDRLLDGDICGAHGCEPTWLARRAGRAELQAGLAFTARGWLASFAYLWRSAEVSAPPAAARDQYFGRLTLGRSW